MYLLPFLSSSCEPAVTGLYTLICVELCQQRKKKNCYVNARYSGSYKVKDGERDKREEAMSLNRVQQAGHMLARHSLSGKTRKFEFGLHECCTMNICSVHFTI